MKDLRDGQVYRLIDTPGFGVIAVLAIVISVCLCGKVFKVPCNNAINKICKKL